MGISPSCPRGSITTQVRTPLSGSRIPPEPTTGRRARSTFDGATGAIQSGGSEASSIARYGSSCSPNRAFALLAVENTPARVARNARAHLLPSQSLVVALPFGPLIAEPPPETVILGELEPEQKPDLVVRRVSPFRRGVLKPDGFSAGNTLRSERFWAKVDRSDDEGCWLWQASTSGHMKKPSVRWQGHLRSARAVAWELTHGPVPPESVVVAACRTPGCVRPDHLRVVPNKAVWQLRDSLSLLGELPDDH